MRVRRLRKSELDALRDAGVRFKVEGREIIVAVPYEGEIRDGLTWADIDTEATDAQAVLACATIPGLGGYAAGWGGWHLHLGYQPAKGDWNDRSSEHHY